MQGEVQLSSLCSSDLGVLPATYRWSLSPSTTNHPELSAFLAEQQGHHPVFHNEFSYVRIELNTHDAGHVVTERDRKLADAIDRLLQ